ncbi:ATP-grasp domain-containing protein [Butyrivibrio sp.]|uniref:ATP-grasp domain-containing protein n=1 Tax=Butyrivibrio sp. TaxID=28121 RepID=UPI0025C1775F|nr:ATP-grasp domain-containing protein [Butyrivibrio sp.]MBQ9305610.1 ATP-grasp domain-containing protein [Butyrivibrio sp.]
MKTDKEKRTIIINKCYSSSVNYIHDIRELGFEPVLLEPYFENPEVARVVHEDYEHAYSLNGDSHPLVIFEGKEYEETLEKVKEFNPLLILPGCDSGIELALRLSDDLELKGNPYSAFLNMRDKYRMQETLRMKGIQYAHTVLLKSENDAITFFKSMKGKKVVYKSTRGSATEGVHICSSEDEVKRAYNDVGIYLVNHNCPGEQILGQEYLEGIEYALDTVSCCGRHVALYGWRYQKRILEGYATLYDRTIYISPADGEYFEITEYVFSVLSALGIQYGPVHSEVIVTDSGPVLVEVNCRPGGGAQKYTFQDKLMQQHETLVSLHSYLMNPEDFRALYPEKMSLKQSAAQKDICINKEIKVKTARLDEACGGLKSFDYAISAGDNRIYPVTTNLTNVGGTVYLTCDDEKQLNEDLDYISRLEKEHPELLFEIDNGTQQET